MKLKKIHIIIIVTVLSVSFLQLGNHNDIRNSRLTSLLQNEKINAGPGYFPGEWMANQRAYPYGEVKLSSYLAGMKEARVLHEQSTEQRYSWELAGPTNTGGRITDIAIHPDSPDTWYIGAASGGIFKTLDAGGSWENIFTDTDVISIGDLAIDPNAENIIYAGTGEANASSYSFFGNGVYKSVDAGATWTHAGLENSAYIGRIVVDPNNSQRIFSAACGNLFTPDEHRGIYRSLDGGGSWEKILFITDSTSAIDIIQHPNDPDVLYAAMWERMRGRNYRRSFGVSSGIYMTTDGGDNWSQLTNGLPVGSATGRIGIDISLANPDILYAFYDFPGSIVGVYRSDDGGENWIRKFDNPLWGMNSYFGWYFGQVRVDPENANRVFVLGVYSYRSDDGGNSWQELGNWGFHVDHHALYIDENTGFCVEGNDGGLYTSSNYGNTWTKINNLPITQFYHLEVDFLNPERIYGGTQDNNTIRTLTGSIHDWHAILGGDGFYSLVDYTNSNIIYAEYQWGQLHKSTNGGNSFSYIAWPMSSDRTNWSSPLAMHPTNPGTLYFGTYRVWKSESAGNSWTAVSTDLTDGDDGSTFHTVSTIAVSPVNPQIVMAGTDDGHVHISVNGGGSWSEISEGLPDRWITRVACDPFDENTVYTTVSGFRWDEPQPHVFKSNNLGQNWISISSNLPDIPVNVIDFDPDYPGRIFVGTDAGVFYTKNGGDSWAGISEGMANVAVTAMKIHERTLFVGTYGLSAFKIDLDDIAIGVPEMVRTRISGFEIYPNPLRLEQKQGINITIELAMNSMTDISLFALSGEKISTVVKGMYNQGMHHFKWAIDGSKITSGLYILRMKSGDEQITRKILILN
ncbi:MAG: T9SS type A sorting domain-containing protein [Bacteroidales bacterium]|nr:T9SS type A sorting domain-containing protein [Bacteroidales bacterium]